MKLQINGELVDVPDSVSTVSALLEHFGLQSKIVMIEHNRTILAKELHSTQALQDQDQIEIVQFVGGG